MLFMVLVEAQCSVHPTTLKAFNGYYQRGTIDALVANTNYRYGDRQIYRGSNVVLPNGNVDPWHVLGLYGSIDPTVVSYLLNGTAHCADMYPAREADVPDLKIVRNLIDQNIAIWLNQAPAPTQTTQTPQTPGTGSTVSLGTGPTANPNATTVVPPQSITQSATSSTFILSFIAILARYLL